MLILPPHSISASSLLAWAWGRKETQETSTDAHLHADGGAGGVILCQHRPTLGYGPS